MAGAPEWRAEVATRDLLNRLVDAPLLFGLRAGGVTQSFHRDTYFDTVDWSLRRRAVTCRFRVRFDDRRLLRVETTAQFEGAGPTVVPQRFETDVPELEGVAALGGQSEPARRLRALIDPSHLVARVALETERRVRHTQPGWFTRGEFELVYDVVTVRGQALSGAFQELKIRWLRRGRPTLDALTDELRQRFGLRPLLVGKLDRAVRVLRDLESAELVRAVAGACEVAVIAIRDGRLAMPLVAGSLVVPASPGSGEQACRQVLREVFGNRDAQVHLLGTAPSAPTRPPLEVWLARRVEPTEEDPTLQWVSLEDVVARVGSPLMREPRTLAALTVAARSDLVSEWPTAPSGVAAIGPLLPLRDGGPTVRARTAPGPEAVRLSLPGERPSLQPEHLLNAERSWLEFDARVLALAEDPTVPLLERVGFLSIFSSNLDEFVMVHVGALKGAAAAGTLELSDDGLTPQERLAVCAIRLRPLLERQARCLREACLPELAAHGIRILGWPDVPASGRAWLTHYFAEQIFPVLTPQAITRAPGHTFPLVPNLRLSLAVLVRDVRSGADHFAYLRLPDGLPRFVPLPDSRDFVPLEAVICANLDALYPGREVRATHCFRVTRSADLALDERAVASLPLAMQQYASHRPYGAAIRVEVERDMLQAMRDLLLRELQFEEPDRVSLIGPGDVYDVDGLLGLAALRELADLPIPELRYPPFRGGTAFAAGRTVLATIAARDVLVHHPYDAFDRTVGRFFSEAADDPETVAMKLTLYRAGASSEILDALRRAAKAGKEVFVFVEVKARFDEERNIEWLAKLEEAGIRVVSGLVGFKTHAKAALVVRREAGALKRFVHIGTGNYNAATALIYTDLGLFTADEALGGDLNDLFNELSGSSLPPASRYRRLVVAPTRMLATFLALIEREAEHVRAGRAGRVRAKLNGLTDPDIIAVLYRASEAGVAIDLLVRAMCTLRPGVPGLSSRIRVVSGAGRFLEHARIYHFGNGGDDEYYLGSADWRPRNLRRRVEVATPVTDPACRQRLDEILTIELNDPTAWDLDADGAYHRRSAASAAGSAQQQLLRRACAG
jgi:polyphosphate kinase